MSDWNCGEALLHGEDAVLVQSCSTNADAVVSVDAQRGISSAEYELNHLGHGFFPRPSQAYKRVVSIGLIYINECSAFPKDIRSEGKDVRGSRHGT
jgi:hypothetical protein